jgi:hypothetical protein
MRQPLGARPLSRVIAPSSFRPRQFEYNPHRDDELVLGSVSGDVLVLNYHTGAVIGQTRAPGPAHSILGALDVPLSPRTAADVQALSAYR